MTLAIASPSFYGGAFVISDTRVNWRNGRWADCLQKLYPINNGALLAFAGSVKIGFQLLDVSRQILRGRNAMPANLELSIRTHLSSAAATIFRRSERIERQLGAQLLMATAVEQNSTVIPTVYRAESPMFEFEIATIVRGEAELVFGIGSGMRDDPYNEGDSLITVLRRYREATFPPPATEFPLDAETQIMGARFRDIVRYERQTGYEKRVKDVAPHIHIGKISPAGPVVSPFEWGIILGEPHVQKHPIQCHADAIAFEKFSAHFGAAACA